MKELEPILAELWNPDALPSWGWSLLCSGRERGEVQETCHFTPGLLNHQVTPPQTVKNLPAVQETQVRSLGWEEPLEKEMATHSSILAWRILWTEDPGGLWPMGSQRVGHDWATNTAATIPPRRSTFSLLKHHCATSSSLQGTLEQPVTTRGRRTAARLPWQGAAFRDRRSQRQGFSALPTLCWPSAQAAVLRSSRGAYLRHPGNQRTHRSIKSRVYYFFTKLPNPCSSQWMKGRLHPT